MNLSQLNQRISLWEITTPLSLETMKKINDTLLYLEADIQNDDHVNNIKELKKTNKSKKEEYVLVIEKGICPICGHEVIMNKNIYSCPNCKYKLVV